MPAGALGRGPSASSRAGGRIGAATRARRPGRPSHAARTWSSIRPTFSASPSDVSFAPWTKNRIAAGPRLRSVGRSSGARLLVMESPQDRRRAATGSAQAGEYNAGGPGGRDVALRGVRLTGGERARGTRRTRTPGDVRRPGPDGSVARHLRRACSTGSGSWGRTGGRPTRTARWPGCWRPRPARCATAPSTNTSTRRSGRRSTPFSAASDRSPANGSRSPCAARTAASSSA